MSSLPSTFNAGGQYSPTSLHHVCLSMIYPFKMLNVKQGSSTCHRLSLSYDSAMFQTADLSDSKLTTPTITPPGLAIIVFICPLCVNVLVIHVQGVMSFYCIHKSFFFHNFSVKSLNQTVNSNESSHSPSIPKI